MKSFEIEAIKHNDLELKLWTINLKSFEISDFSMTENVYTQWTINLKSFEIHLKVGEL